MIGKLYLCPDSPAGLGEEIWEGMCKRWQEVTTKEVFF